MYASDLLELLRAAAATTVFAGLLVACAEGKEPPAKTALVQVTTDLTFTFGEDAPCFVGQEQTGGEEICQLQVQSLIEQWFPTVEVTVEPFSIDMHEVTNVQYEYCMAMERCSEPEADQALAPDQQDYYENEVFNDFPVIRVSWQQATEYCDFVGRRLPTEVEWERAAKGGGSLARPYAADGVQSMSTCQIKQLPTNTCASSQSTVDATDAATQDFVTENGGKIFHLFGNVAEWTADGFEADLTCRGPGPCGGDTCFNVCTETDGSGGTGRCLLHEGALTAADLRTESGDQRVVRGGSVNDQEGAGCNSRTGTRRGIDATQQSPWLGFRCARSL